MSPQLAQDVGRVVDLGGGILLSALGLVLLFVRPRRPVSIAIAIFALTFGGSFLLRGLSDHFPSIVAWSEWTAMALEAASAPALIYVAIRFPGVRARARTVVLAAVLATLFAAWWLITTVVFAGLPLVLIGETPGFFDGLAYPITSIFLNAGSLAFAVFCWTLRHAEIVQGQATARRSMRLVVLGLGFFFVLRAGTDAAFTGALGDPAAYANYFGILLSCVAMSGLWAIQARGPDGAACRNLALLFGLGPIAALLYGRMAATGHEVWGLGLLGLGRLLFVTTIAYGILREQLFDIDIKLKWGLQKGTLAGIFLAVFFVAAQLAQNFLSQEYGWALGGVAAGILLFAIAPIQRVAERVSDKAMPNVRPEDPSYVLRRKQETYRNAYATAWSDGSLTPKDMRMLQQVRDALRLPEKVIFAIEKEWTGGAVGKPPVTKRS